MLGKTVQYSAVAVGVGVVGMIIVDETHAPIALGVSFYFIGGLAGWVLIGAGLVLAFRSVKRRLAGPASRA